ncbi:MAG: hypothetical protein ACRYGC_12630 [Janthinobacterium lividum]
MANSIRITTTADQAPSGQAGSAQGGAAGAGFGDTLAAHVAASHVHHRHHVAAHARVAAHGAHARHHVHAQKSASVITDTVQHALAQAMRLEQVPASWHAGLQFIMAQESAGKVGVRNHVDTARSLFQLTRASYGLNPNGAGSFGNAVEEAQGGIRYIRQRYGTADNAADFWRQRRWY